MDLDCIQLSPTVPLAAQKTAGQVCHTVQLSLQIEELMLWFPPDLPKCFLLVEKTKVGMGAGLREAATRRTGQGLWAKDIDFEAGWPRSEP